MCILFFVAGDEDRPSLVCSNRDEFFARPTARGELDGRGRYRPRDLEGGGTWLSFDNVRHDSQGLRFSVVLNYHHWRDDESNLATDKARDKLLSRGKLVSNFIEGSTAAREYAQDVFSTRDAYRPFNLIVSDEGGCFYVSSSASQLGPHQLVAGQLYAISNGYIDHYWAKTALGSAAVASVIDRFDLKDLGSHLRTSCALHNIQALPPDAAVPLPAFLRSLLDIMKNPRPLSDPTFGDDHPALCRLGGVFASPTLIANTFLCAQSFTELLGAYLVPGQEVDLSSHKLFGTRTVTLLVHWGPSFVRMHRPGCGVAFVIVEDDINDQQESSVRIVSNIPLSNGAA